MKKLPMKTAYNLLGIHTDVKTDIKILGKLCNAEEFYQLGLKVAYRKDYNLK